MAGAPLVSLGMPVHNGERFVGEAIDSVLAQSFEDFELLIADNASTDATPSICRDYALRDSRIRYVRHSRNLGAARNFNFTFEHSRGTYFKWMAHDDLIAPTYLERCLERFECGPAPLVLCYPLRRTMAPDGRVSACADSGDGGASRVGDGEGDGDAPAPLGPTLPGLLRCGADAYPMFVFGLMRTAALRRTRLLGAFPSADLVLVTELRMLGPFGEVPETLYFQRRHVADAMWRARASKRGEAHWYAPDAPTHRVVSSWRLFLEHLRGITAAPAQPRAKAEAYLAMAGYFPHRIRRLLRERMLIHRIREELSPNADPRLY